MATVAGRFKGQDFIIKGEVEERLPRITNGLQAHFPFDGSIQDRLTEFYLEQVTTSARDWTGDYFPTQYDYKNMTLFVSGRVMCEEAVDWSMTTSIGFNYMGTDTTNGSIWRAAKTFTLKDVQQRWVDFTIPFKIGTDFANSLRPWIQIGISNGTAGYKVIYEDITYFLAEDPKYITNINTDMTPEYLSIREASKNYIVNGDFSKGLTNWGFSAIATTHEWVYTPYGFAARINRGDGDNGGWTLRYDGTKDWTYKAGETWVWSFKYKINQGVSGKIEDTRLFYVGWWISDRGSWQVYLPVTSIPLDEDGWYLAYASYTFTADFSGNTSCGINSNKKFTVVDITDVRLEQRNFPTNTPDNGTGGDAQFGLNLTLNSTEFSMSAEKRFVTDKEWTKMGMVKDSANNFAFYKNGEFTQEYNNAWQRIKVKGVGIKRNVGYDINNYTDPVEKTYKADPINDFSNLSQDDAGYFFRTYVYCSKTVSTVHRYVADNYGGMRINNGPLVYIGGWENGVDKLNPDVTISLVQGWNLVEFVWMDGDTGGSFALRSGTPLSKLPEVLCMTAELPIEMSNNKMFFNEKSNVDIRNVSVYRKALTQREFRSVHGTKGISIDNNGNLKMVVKEQLPYLPQDAFYFPLGVDANDINGMIKPSKAQNLVFEDGWMWAGRSVANRIKNPSGMNVMPQYSTPGVLSPGWDKSLHPYAIGVVDWSYGYNGGTTVPTTGYHAHWVYEGVNGVVDPCIRFVNRNDLINQPKRWLGVSQSMTQTPSQMGWAVGTNIVLQWKQKGNFIGDGTQAGLYYKNTSGNNLFANGTPTKPISQFNTWEANTHYITLPADIDLNQICSIYVYGHSSRPGVTWVDEIFMAERPFNTPYTESTRGESSLQYNFYNSIGLNWNEDWSIVYFKIPVGTADNTMSGYSIESIGCNSNTVGGRYAWFGKSSGRDTITGATPNGIVPGTYFGKPRMVSLVNKAGNCTIKEWDYEGNVYERNAGDIAPTSAPANAFVTQHGYDFMLGGWDNQGAPNAYYRDLIVAKRAFTDEEVNNLFKTRASSREDALYISGKIVVNPTLS